MFRFETVNELSLRVLHDGNANDGVQLYTKAGAWISGYGQYKWDKMLLGPGGNMLQAAAKQLMRRFTGENLPLMVMKPQGPSETYYANLAQHVVVIDLQPGQEIAVESESILAFTNLCTYSVRFLAAGVLSQKGLATSILRVRDGCSGAQVAILVDGNPMVLNTINSQAGGIQLVRVDPDAMVAFVGPPGLNPHLGFDVGWKTFLGSKGRSGETYYFEFQQPNVAVIVQPNERKSGLDIGIDNHDGHAVPQDNQTFGQAVGGVQQTLGQVGNVLGGNPQGGGIGGILGGLFGS